MPHGPGEERPSVSVIVPHYRDLLGLDRCLEALCGQTYPNSLVQIIVADNNSPEGAEVVSEAVRGRGELVIVDEKGAGPARNGGVERATGDILAFVDSDCVAEPEWLAEGVLALANYDFIGGRVKVLVDNPSRITAAEAFERVFAFDFKTYIEKKGFTGAGNLLVSREVFHRVGGFRTGLSEDLEWSRRAVAMGYRLGYAPRAVVGHPARKTWSELRSKWKRLNFETYGLSAGAPQRRLRWLVRTLLVPVSAVVHTPKVLMSREINGTRERAAALVVLYRLRIWRFFDALALLAPARRG